MRCPVSGAKRGGQCDDDDEDEDGQTDGDPKLLLHRNKENLHLAPELMRVSCDLEKSPLFLAGN